MHARGDSRGPAVTQTAQRAVAAAVCVLAAIVVLAEPGAARQDPARQRREVQRQRARVAAQIDVLRASDAEVERALAAAAGEVDAQEAAVAGARQAARAAAAALVSAEQAQRRKEAEIRALELRMKRLAVEAYVRRPDAQLLDSLRSASLAENARRAHFLVLRARRDAEVFDGLREAREDLADQRAAAAEAARRARERRAQVEVQLREKEAAQRRQEELAAQTEERLDHALSEAAALAALDQQLAEEISRRQAAIAARARAARVAAGSVVRRMGRVPLATVRGIVVHASLADRLEGLLAAAEADGVALSGSGYRDPEQQVALRRAHCGSSRYATYEMPPSRCRPPTARPGTSMHEQGLAVDFTYEGRVISSRSSPGFRWLSANAGRFGLRNLPGEPWHWSVNGK